MNPLLTRMAWHLPRSLDIAAMRQAAGHFVGRHDFASFTSNPGYARATTVRTLTACEVRRRGPEITVRIVGNGFLYRMCRGIAGTLAQVGLHRISPDDIPSILQRKDRRVAGMTAPPEGLVLWRVHYPRPATAAPPDSNADAPDLESEEEPPDPEKPSGGGQATGLET